MILLALAGAAAGGEAPAPASGSANDRNPPRIAWNEWSTDLFKRATEEGKPVLLFVRTPWSRASLWVEEKNYTDPEVVALAGRKWIPVSVDRDRRPDIDQRYQIAVGAVSKGEGGWPLTALLFDTGDVMSGRAYAPLEDRMGKPGLRTLLDKTADYYKANRAKAGNLRDLVMIQFNRERVQVRPASLTTSLIDEMISGMTSVLDKESGGFGPAPRVPTPYVPELAALLHRSRGETRYLDLLDVTLSGMEAGAIHDRVGGGFHRSSNDPLWRHPEFEKLLNYNAALLVDYLLGYQATGKTSFKAAADGIVNYLLDTLAAPGGGFYVAQWAASGPDEPRGVFPSWTEQEFQSMIPAEHAKLASTLFDVRTEGDVTLGPPARNLLYLAMPREMAADRLDITMDALEKGERAILSALARARQGRTAPPVEKAIYVDSCASAVFAMFEAHAILGREDAYAAAVKGLDRLLAGVPAVGPMLHRADPAPVPGLDAPFAMDHILLARAAIAGYEATGERRYLTAARDLVERAIALFWDADQGGFFDIVADPQAPGFLSLRRRLPNDTSYPSLNSIASRVLDRLWMHTGTETYHERARTSLAGLISMTGKVNQHDAGIGLALQTQLSPPARYVVVGTRDEVSTKLLTAARRLYDPGKIVQHLQPGRDDSEIARLGLDTKARAGFAVMCRGGKCSAPARDEASVRQLGWLPENSQPR